MEKVLSFPDGGKLTVAYTGSGNGQCTLTAPPNYGLDRSLRMTIATTQGKAIVANVGVTQYGMREVFNAKDGELLFTDGTFNVLKS